METNGKTLTVKLTPDEWDKLNYLVAKTGLNTRSAYVKAAIFNKTIRVVKTSLATERVLANLNAARRDMEASRGCLERYLSQPSGQMDKDYMNRLCDGLKEAIINFGELINHYEEVANEEKVERKYNELS